MAEFNKTNFIKGLATKINGLDAMLESLLKIAGDWRVRLDTEGGMDAMRELGKKSVLGGKRPFERWGGTFEDYEKSLAKMGEDIVEYVNDGLLACPRNQRESVRKTVIDCFNLAKDKAWPRSPNRDYIKALFRKIVDRIIEMLTIFDSLKVPSEMPAPSVLWGGKRWRIIPANYVKKLERQRKQMYSKKTQGGASCNAWNHPPDCHCGWGGTRLA